MHVISLVRLSGMTSSSDNERSPSPAIMPAVNSTIVAGLNLRTAPVRDSSSLLLSSASLLRLSPPPLSAALRLSLLLSPPFSSAPRTPLFSFLFNSPTLTRAALSQIAAQSRRRVVQAPADAAAARQGREHLQTPTRYGNTVNHTPPPLIVEVQMRGLSTTGHASQLCSNACGSTPMEVSVLGQGCEALVTRYADLVIVAQP